MRGVAATLVIAGCSLAPESSVPAPETQRVTRPALAPRSPPASPVPRVVAPGRQVPVLEHAERRGDYRLRHFGVMAHAVTRDGRFGATGSQDGSLVVWDLRDGYPVTMIATAHGTISSVAISPDGTLVSSSGRDDTVRTWDVATGTQRWTAAIEADALEFSSDGRRLFGQHRLPWRMLARGAEQRYRVWDALDGRVVLDTTSEEQPCDLWAPPFAIAPDGHAAIRLVAKGCHESSHGCVIETVPSAYDVTEINLDTKAEVRIGSVGHAPTAVAFSARGDRLAVLDYDHLSVFEVSTGRRLAYLETLFAPPNDAGLALTSDGRYAIAWSAGDMVSWDLHTNREVWRHAIASNFFRPRLAGDDTVIVHGDAGHCAAQRIADGAELWRRDACSAAAVGRTSMLISRAPSALDVVDAVTGLSLMKPMRQDSPLGFIMKLAVGADHAVAAISYDQTAWLWDARGSRQLPDLPTHIMDAGARFVGGELVISLPAERRNVRYGGDPIRGVSTTESPSRGAAHTYTRGDYGTLQIWNARSHTRLVQVSTKLDISMPLVLSPDETLVIVGAMDGTVELRSPVNLRVLRRLVGATGMIWSAAVSPDGALVIAAANDGLFVWRRADGTLITTVDFSASREAPTAIEFSLDGRTLSVGTTLGNLHRFTVLPP